MGHSRFMLVFCSSTVLFAAVSTSAFANYQACKVLKKIGGGAAANYKFEATGSDGKKTTICVKGQTINDQSAIQMCKNG
jgi:hypothetical protein